MRKIDWLLLAGSLATLILAGCGDWDVDKKVDEWINGTKAKTWEILKDKKETEPKKEDLSIVWLSIDRKQIKQSIKYNYLSWESWAIHQLKRHILYRNKGDIEFTLDSFEQIKEIIDELWLKWVNALLNLEYTLKEIKKNKDDLNANHATRLNELLTSCSTLSELSEEDTLRAELELLFNARNWTYWKNTNFNVTDLALENLDKDFAIEYLEKVKQELESKDSYSTSNFYKKIESYIIKNPDTSKSIYHLTPFFKVWYNISDIYRENFIRNIEDAYDNLRLTKSNNWKTVLELCIEWIKKYEKLDDFYDYLEKIIEDLKEFSKNDPKNSLAWLNKILWELHNIETTEAKKLLEKIHKTFDEISTRNI